MVERRGERDRVGERSLPLARLSLRILLPPLISDDPSTKSPIILSLPSKSESRVFIHVHISMCEITGRYLPRPVVLGKLPLLCCSPTP